MLGQGHRTFPIEPKGLRGEIIFVNANGPVDIYMSGIEIYAEMFLGWAGEGAFSPKVPPPKKRVFRRRGRALCVSHGGRD